MTPTFTPEEVQAIEAAGARPEDFAVLVVTASSAGQAHQLVRVPTPQGPVDCVLMPFLLFVPLNTFRPASRVLTREGKAPSPAEGTIPTAHLRLIVPRARLAAGAMDGESANGPMDDESTNGPMPVGVSRLFLPPEPGDG